MNNSLNEMEQSISNGNNNIQIGRDQVNYYIDYTTPKAITFHEKDIVHVIEVFNKQYGYDELENYNEKIIQLSSLEKTKIEVKNKKNKLSEAYFEGIKNRYLHYFFKIDEFLKSPINKKLLRKYQKNANVMNMQILAIRDQFQSFEEILNFILRDTINREESELEDNTDIFGMFLNYMYWNCDIGER